ncbi:MAG: SHOCT domain-containing protein [Coriobacteriia bacterium]|nr:SHOCT domain-containing protein [Coriobacteriia bacterium]
MTAFGFGSGLLGSLGMVGLTALLPALAAAMIAWFVLVAAKAPDVTPARASRIDEAVEIVRQRFARGEIDAEEYSRLVSGLTRTV